MIYICYAEIGNRFIGSNYTVEWQVAIYWHIKSEKQNFRTFISKIVVPVAVSANESTTLAGGGRYTHRRAANEDPLVAVLAVVDPLVTGQPPPKCRLPPANVLSAALVIAYRLGGCERRRRGEVSKNNIIFVYGPLKWSTCEN